MLLLTLSCMAILIRYNAKPSSEDGFLTVLKGIAKTLTISQLLSRGGGSLTLQGGLSFVPMVLEYSEKIGGGWDRLGILGIQNMYIILYEVFVKIIAYCKKDYHSLSGL